MRSDRELLEDALCLIDSGTKGGMAYDIIREIRARLAEPEDEPVAWLHTDESVDMLPLYLRPRQPVQLSDEEIENLFEEKQMNELIASAKIVCDVYDYTGPLDECEAVNRLYEAVQRAESSPPVRLSDEEIQECFDAGQKSFLRHQSGIKGQQLNIRDWPYWHFAKAIEQAILERNQ